MLSHLSVQIIWKHMFYKVFLGNSEWLEPHLKEISDHEYPYRRVPESFNFPSEPAAYSCIRFSC